MVVLTPAERRVALLLASLLVLGAASDLLDRRRAPPLEPAGRLVDTAEVTKPPVGGAETAPPAAEPEPRLDLNRASARELDGLPGVGPVLAARIVEQRARLGGFHAIEDLRAVRGIGPRLLERLRPRVRLAPAAADTARSVSGRSHPERSLE